jgi:uncharacterized membrane protein
MVLESILFGLASGQGFGVSDLGAAAVTRRVGVLRAAVSIQLVAVAVMSPYLLVESGIGALSAIEWLELGGLAGAALVFYLAFYRALQLGPVAIISPILAAHTAVVVVLAVLFLDEHLSAWQSVSIAVTIGGIVLASVDTASLGSGQRIVGAGVALALFISVAAGMWQYGIGALSRDLGWFLPLYLTKLFMLGGLVPLGAARGAWPWRRTTRLVACGTVGVALVETGSLFAFTRGAQIGILSIVAASSAVYPVVPIIGGIVLFNERLAANQVVGLAVMLVGLVGLGAVT